MHWKHVKREAAAWTDAMRQVDLDWHLPMDVVVETLRALPYTIGHLAVYGLLAFAAYKAFRG